MSAAGLEERRRLLACARALGIALAEADAARLSSLLDELERWNRAYNLTAIRAREEMVSKHLLDSLSVAPYLAGERVLDVGTGAGFPGLPLAVAEPGRRFTLLDASGKKIRFVEHAARRLGLGNVQAEQARVERYGRGGGSTAGFDTIVGRAFAPAGRFAAACGHLLAPGGRLLMMKGRRPSGELAELGGEWAARVIALEVPELDEERHLIWLTRRGGEQ